MIYGRHMGLKSSVVKEVEAGHRAELEKSEAGRKALQLKGALDDLKAECRAGAMHARAVYQFFRARGEGNDLVLLDSRGADAARFTFPRQEGADELCLSDYVAADDAVALFVTTAGAGIRGRAEAYKKNGDFLKSHLLQALALETAEGYAELLHAKLRSQWGFPDPLEMTMMICSIPAATASSTAYWMIGRSTSGIISLGIALEAGRKRVPNPAAGRTALRTRTMRGALLGLWGRQSGRLNRHPGPTRG